MAIALVASVNAGPGSNGGVTASIDTTGANLIVVTSTWYGGGAASVITDSKSNTYTPLTQRDGSTTSHRIFYKFAPSVGSGHTFTVTAGGGYPSIIVYAFSGIASYHSENGAGSASSVASLACGNVTPSANGALIVTGSGAGTPATDTVSTSGFSTPITKAHSGGVNMQGSASYYVQPTAATINPTWAYSPSQNNVAVGTAVFLASTVIAVTKTQLFIVMP